MKITEKNYFKYCFCVAVFLISDKNKYGRKEYRCFSKTILEAKTIMAKY